jgi:sterol desaturase/sphingolipid hydroxylase (fatty acid hydroxylase superfamily)
MLLFNIIFSSLSYLSSNLYINLDYSTYWLSFLVSKYIIGESIYLLKHIKYFDKYKLINNLEQATKVSNLSLYTNTLTNHVIFIPFLFIYKNFINYTTYNFYITSLEVLFNSVVFLIIFEVGHYFLHLKYFYKYHKKHHQTYADRSITSTYMDKLDYLLEVAIPFFAGPFLYKSSYLSFLIWSQIALLNSLINHSGYSCRFISSKEHHDHHLNKN